MTPQTPPAPMCQILTLPNRCLLLLLLSLLSALIRTLERRTHHARPIAELLTLLMAGDSRWSLKEAGETEEKEGVDEEDMQLVRFLLLRWRTTWPSSACLQQKAAVTMQHRRTPVNTKMDI